MEGGSDSGFSNFPHSKTFPPNSWFIPSPQLAPPYNIVSNQCHQSFDTYKGTSIPSSAFGNFSSSSGSGIGSSYEEAGIPIIPPLPIDQGLGDVNMFLDGGQHTMDKVSDHPNNPNVNFSNDVINPKNQIANDGTKTSKSYTKRLWTAEEDRLNLLS